MKEWGRRVPTLKLVNGKRKKKKGELLDKFSQPVRVTKLFRNAIKTEDHRIWIELHCGRVLLVTLGSVLNLWMVLKILFPRGSKTCTLCIPVLLMVCKQEKSMCE